MFKKKLVLFRQLIREVPQLIGEIYIICEVIILTLLFEYLSDYDVLITKSYTYIFFLVLILNLFFFKKRYKLFHAYAGSKPFVPGIILILVIYTALFTNFSMQVLNIVFDKTSVKKEQISNDVFFDDSKNEYTISFTVSAPETRENYLTVSIKKETFQNYSGMNEKYHNVSVKYYLRNGFLNFPWLDKRKILIFEQSKKI
ncbi:MAG: hypothetical protein WC635_05780 [Bacteriovorax sp.]|jgi:hypothetical protein